MIGKISTAEIGSVNIESQFSIWSGLTHRLFTERNSEASMLCSTISELEPV